MPPDTSGSWRSRKWLGSLPPGSTYTTSPGSSTWLTLVIALARVGPATGFAHFTPSRGRMPTWRSLEIAPPGSRGGCKPMRAACSPLSRTTAPGGRRQADAGGLIAAVEPPREPPRRDIGKRAHFGELEPPVAVQVDLGEAAVPAFRFVEAHEAVMERLARHHLQLGIERGAHREPALVKLGLAVLLVDLAPHFFGEIFGREDMRAGRARRDVERLLLRLLAFLRRDVAVLDQALDHVVA